MKNGYDYLNGFIENIEAWDAEDWAKIYCRRSFSEEQKNHIWRNSKKKCAYCNKKQTRKTVRFDHIKSWKKGGATEISNGATSCHSCNLRKGHSTDKLCSYDSTGVFLRKCHKNSIGIWRYFCESREVKAIFKEARNG